MGVQYHDEGWDLKSAKCCTYDINDSFFAKHDVVEESGFWKCDILYARY